MNGWGVDEVLMPGQVAALRRRVEILASTREACARELEATTGEVAALSQSKPDDKAYMRAVKRANRLRLEDTALLAEIQTLESLVAARISRARGGP